VPTPHDRYAARAVTDYEPYVADPAEPAPLARYPGLRPLAGTLAIVVLLAALVLLVLKDRALQDPSLDVPASVLPSPAP
jgi:hypothetical protein